MITDINVTVTSIPTADLEADLLLMLLPTGCREHLEQLADELGEAFRRAAEDFNGEKGQTSTFYPERAAALRVALLGLGDAGEMDLEQLRRAAASGAEIAVERKADTAAVVVPHLEMQSQEEAHALVEGFMLGGYRFVHYKTREDDAFGGPAHLKLRAGQNISEQELSQIRGGARRGYTLALATITARNLVNLSPNEKNAPDLASMVEKAGRAHGYDTQVWDKKRIKKEGMGGLLAVNRGSVEPPTFTVMEWKPTDPVNANPIVLVGKTVVFDTGGLSLKPTKNSMDYMKADMAGGAAVIGTFEAAAELGLPVHLIGLIPATDNRPGENAYVPGDVIRMHDGTTVEVLNTDAEGRLTLADALSYAKKFDPELVIDLATLTGAAVVALGSEAAAVMSSEDEASEGFRRDLEQAGRQAGDPLHPLPMYDAYSRLLESNIADLKNIGGKEAGAISAAKFLEHFVDYPWVHLDIAGPAFLHEAKPYRPKGGTGYGVRLLVQFLRTYTDR